MSDGTVENTASHWHAIRPWAPSLSLAVREITSVSATFILSSSLSGDMDSSLASIGLEAAEEGPERTQDLVSGDTDSSLALWRKTNSVIADALAKGLSVNVNGSAWPRAFIRIDDQLDEAVIIIYALMPGRQYDIELGLAPVGQLSSTIRRQVTTEEESEHDNAETNAEPDSLSVDNTTSSSDPNSTPSTSPSTLPGTPPPQMTLEDRLTQLQHTLSATNSEREALVSSLKTARKDSQKADSVLRAEIEVLKRTSEKNTAAELRGKQKVLALQEAVKRAQNATKEIEELAEEGKRQEPALNARKKQKEAEHAKLKQQADRVRRDREEVEEKDNKRLEAMKAELAGLTTKLEKLGGKREKLETAVIPDLEEKLKETEKEIELEEQSIAQMERENLDDSYVHVQRFRQYSGEEKQPAVGRPALAPIQRPAHADHNNSLSNHVLLHSTSSPWSPTQSYQLLSQAQKTGQTHNARSHSLNSHSQQNHTGPALVLNPQQRRGSLKSNAALSTPTSTSLVSVSSMTPTTTSSPNSSPTRTSPGAPLLASTLSSRAPAFEPSRSGGAIKGTNCHNNHIGGGSMAPTSGFSSLPGAMTIQRASGSAAGTTRSSNIAGAKNGSQGHTNWLTMYGHHTQGSMDS